METEVIVWLPDPKKSNGANGEDLLLKLHEVGVKFHVARFPEHTETNLVVGNEMYSGGEAYSWVQRVKQLEKRNSK